MAGAGAAAAGSIRGRKMGDFAVVNAQGRRMWFPLACMESSVMVSQLPRPVTGLLSIPLPLSCHSSQQELKTQGPLPGPQPWVHL